MIVAGIPAYNEEKTIAEIVNIAQKYVDKVIVCDDGSNDMTRKIAEKQGADVVCHDKNMGYGATLCSLFKRARELNVDTLVTLDGDGQHDPNDIPTLVKTLYAKNADVVNGSRFNTKSKKSSIPLVRRIGNKFFTRIINTFIMGKLDELSVSDALSGFKCYSKRALESLNFNSVGKETNINILIMRQISFKKLFVTEVPILINYEGLKCHKRSIIELSLQIFYTILFNVIKGNRAR